MHKKKGMSRNILLKMRALEELFFLLADGKV
jgi:hypothetical protein